MAERELLLSRIVAALVWLRHAGVLDGPTDPRIGLQLPGPGSPAAMLWEWSRLISDVDALLSEVLEPAAREPGRVHRRSVQVHRDHPRGAVHWPRTMQQTQARIEVGGPRFWCTTAHRSLLAPENLLLVWTLDEWLARGLLVGGRIEPEALLDEEQRASVRRLPEQLRRAEATAWVGACRVALRELQRDGAGAIGRLEREVGERVRGRPSAAPNWARSLLELRRRPATVPTRAALDRIDAGTLWEQLAWLEVLSLLRTGRGLRRRGHVFVGAGGLELRAIDGTPTWRITAPERTAIGILCVGENDAMQVQMQGLRWMWDTRIERWLIVHRGEERHRLEAWKGIELCHAQLLATGKLAGELRGVLGRWLGEVGR